MHTLPHHFLLLSSLFAILTGNTVVDATISPSFSAFLLQKYGEESEKLLARRDLGPAGSFGGGAGANTRGRHRRDLMALKFPGIVTYRAEEKRRRPIVMVHGLSTVAGEYENLRQYFLLNGYTDAEIFATTYAFGPLNWTQDSMECQHVKQMRLMIIAVSEYADSQVDVIGYSMGSPLARKAILGGRCVDTGEELGPSLTPLIHTFVGVAGANSGATYLCKLFGDETGPCNNVNGIRCHSEFLDDLNGTNETERRRFRYEASSRIYTIYSLTDEIVGYEDCDGKLVSKINGQNGDLKLLAHTHFSAIFLTFKEQLDMLNSQFDPKFNVTVNWRSGIL